MIALGMQASAITYPTLWVSNLLTAHRLNNELFQLVEYGKGDSDLAPGEHYILVEKGTPEAQIKAIAWRIAASSGECLVHSVNNYLENLVSDQVTAREFTISIIEFARPYSEWAALKDETKLTLREAADIARLAIALLPEPQRSIELGTLRERCNQSSYDWNKLVDTLEEEFKREVERRLGTDQPVDKSESEKPKLTKREAVEQAKQIIQSGLDELEESLQLEELREESGLSFSFWERQVLPPLRRSLQSTKLTLEIQAYLRETDLARQFTERNRITSRYRITNREFDQQCHAIRFAERQSAEKPRLISPKELFNLESKNLDWLVPGFLPRHMSAMVSGLPGTGKSLLSIDLAYAVATGGLFLGEQVKQGKVLIINSDQPLNVTASYLSDRGFDEDTPNWKVIGQTGNMAAWTIKDLDLLETWLSETKPDLVIIDSIRTTICYPLGLEEKSELVGHWLKEVERLVIRYGSLLWVHHDNKDTNLAGVSRSSGSTAIPGNVSVHWRLEKASKDDSDPNRIFSMPKTRLFEPSTLTVRFDNTNGQWLNLGRVGESPDVAKQNQSLQQRVLDLLQQRPSVGFEVQEIREKVGGGDSLYTVLSRMVQRGIISKRRGKTSKSKVYFWENNFSPNTQQETVENLEKVAQPPLSQFSQLSVRNETEKLTAHESCSPNSHLTLTQKSPNSCESTGHVLGDENSCPVSDTAINQSHLTPHLTGGGGFCTSQSSSDENPSPSQGFAKGDEVYVMDCPKLKDKRMTITSITPEGIWVRSKNAIAPSGPFKPRQLRKC